jgi:hypothetical protein
MSRTVSRADGVATWRALRSGGETTAPSRSGRDGSVTDSDSQAGESCVSFIATDEASVSDGDAGVAGLDWQHGAAATLFAQRCWARRHTSSFGEVARAISGVLTNPTAIAIDTSHRIHEGRATPTLEARLVPNDCRRLILRGSPAARNTPTWVWICPRRVGGQASADGIRTRQWIAANFPEQKRHSLLMRYRAAPAAQFITIVIGGFRVSSTATFIRNRCPSGLTAYGIPRFG